MEPECTRCAVRLDPPPSGSPLVPGFRTGDRVWPRADGPMALQAAPQTVLAAYTDPALGSWLWLDAGGGRLGSWAAEWWTTQEPGEAEKAATAARVQQREEENAQVPERARRYLYHAGGPGYPGCSPEEPAVPLRLPAYMATGYQAAGIKGDREWHDVFPGQLQARYSDYNEARDAHLLDFRLTPQDGQARD